MIGREYGKNSGSSSSGSSPTCVVGSPIDCAATVPTTSPGAAMAFMNLRISGAGGRAAGGRQAGGRVLQ